MPSGDNASAVRVNTETLHTKVYTRGDFPEVADIITLVEYIKGIYFSHAIKWLCDICGYSYYDGYEKEEEETDPCVLWLSDVSPRIKRQDEEKLQIYPESILNEYIQVPNVWFLKDNISYNVQRRFEVGFDMYSQRIAIPIRDELGNLVGVKGRTIDDDYEKKGISKYFYLKPTAKSKILYGLDKSYPYIKQTGGVFVFESEKAVQQAWTMGVKNAVGCGGHMLSSTQVIKLEKLGVPIILSFDKGLSDSELEKEYGKFIISGVYSIQDKMGLLKDKESPSDKGKDVFKELYCKGLRRVK